MSGLDVEALLDSTAANDAKDPGKNVKEEDRSDRHKHERSERRDRDRHRDDSRDRDRDRKRRDRSRDRRHDRDGDGALNSPRSDRGSINGSLKGRKRSRSRDEDRRHRREREDDDRRNAAGDFHRSGRRSRTPEDERYYRPGEAPRARRDDRDRERDRDSTKRERKRSTSPKKKEKTPEPQLTEDERDRRTVFVQQLAARLRTKELIQFFEKVGPVKEAQIVKDRVSGRSKGFVTTLFP